MAERARLLPLGTGSILMGGGGRLRGASGYELEWAGAGAESWLLDAGPGSLLQLRCAGLDPARVRRVLLSHYHPDHHLDLCALLFLRRSPALCVYGPAGLARVYDLWRELYGSSIDAPELEIVELAAGSHELGPLRVTAFEAAHPQPAFCYRVELPGGQALAYSGDSGLCDGLVDACRSATLAVVECSFPDEAAVDGHMSPARVLDLCERAAPARVGLTHFYPEMEPLLADAEAFAAHFAGCGSEVFALDDLVACPL